MKELFNIPFSSPEWCLEETTFGLDEQHIQESLFTLGNGFIGSRGVLEELPERALPGTFIAGVYDKAGAQVEELVNLPNPIHFILAAEGEKLDMRFMGFVEHFRFLDMHQGLLARQTLFKDGKNRRFLYQSLRFFSIKHPHTAWMKIAITALDKSADLVALDTLDDTVLNTGGLIYGSRRHVLLKEIDTKQPNYYYAYRTISSGIWVAYSDHLEIERKGESVTQDERVIDFTIEVGETITFTKTMAICTSLQRKASHLKQNTLGFLEKALDDGFENSFKEHVDEWRTRWDHANIVIEGDDLCDRALRFNIYHLLISGYRDEPPMGIGARALTGQGYRGHIFWDMEIFNLPFFIYTDPMIAKRMLLYRHRHLPAARMIARNKGYRGALFPWESAGTGDDATPKYAKDVDGTVLKIDTSDYEHHISADVAYGVYQYDRSTQDIEFMAHHGAEILFLTARFWESRLSYNSKQDDYETKDVIGPDEFHNHIDNNVYTNWMARWNMSYAAEVYEKLKVEAPEAIERLTQHLMIYPQEVKRWKNKIEKIRIPHRSENGVIEQFEGYFDKKDIPIPGYNEFFMPQTPEGMTYYDFQETQFIKQADALLLLHLFPDDFSREDKKKLYHTYIDRTLHHSSLSYSTHALIAAEIGDAIRAYNFYLLSLQMDLKNLHQNTDAGMHMACVGGVWQTTIFGFAGLSFKNDMICIDPRFPGHWKQIQFQCFWKKRYLKFAISHSHVEISVYPVSPDHEETQVIIFGQKQILKPFDTIRIERETPYRKILCVKDIMTALRSKDESIEQSLPCLQENDSVELAIQYFMEYHVDRLLVEKAKVMIGYVTRKELLKEMLHYQL